ASFVLLRWVAGFDIEKPAGLNEFGPLVFKQLGVTVAAIFQYVLPAVFVVGGVAGKFRRSRQSRMLDSYSGGRRKLRGKPGPKSAIPYENVAASVQWTPTWSEFEGLVAEFFRRQGYSVRESEPGPDGGIDLDLRRDGERHLVQCKNWSRPVGVKVVRELKGVMAQEGVPEGTLVAA